MSARMSVTRSLSAFVRPPPPDAAAEADVAAVGEPLVVERDELRRREPLLRLVTRPTSH